MEGPRVIVQIIVFLFPGKRKYNRGRLQLIDRKPDKENSLDGDDLINGQI